MHPVVFFYTTNNRNTQPNTTLQCHITLCYMFQCAQTIIMHFHITLFKRKFIEILLTEQLHTKIYLYFLNCCNTRCLTAVRTILKHVAQCYVTLKCCVEWCVLFFCVMTYERWLKEKPMKKTENMA